MSGHTPKPWQADSGGTIWAGANPIAQANGLWADGGNEKAANARLIAAAPILLDACHWAAAMRLGCECGACVGCIARAAIAQAEGKA